MDKLNANELNSEIMAAVVSEAKEAVAQSGDKQAKRWLNAISNAVAELEANPYFVFEDDTLTILSSTSQVLYSFNRACGCKAFQVKTPCKHLAAKRLIVRYLEKLNSKRTVYVAGGQPKSDVYRRPSNSLGETYKGFQI